VASRAGLAAVLLVTACAQIGPSIPARPGTGPAASAGGGSPQAAAPSAAVRTVSAAGRATTKQLGVQIYWHGVNDDYSVRTNAARLLDYVTGLGANSVGITFPIYTDGATPTRVYTKAGVTPTPSSLGVLIGLAKARGLHVMVRPLIDESNIKNGHGAWRGSIRPEDLDRWFASYRTALTPYLTAAQSAGAEVFVIGSELDSLVGKAAQWRALESAAGAVFRGRLAYADNWGQWATGRPGVPGADPGMDAYPQLHLADSATVPQIAAAWSAWLRKRPAGLSGTVVQEIGIAATRGAYKVPAAWATDSKPVTASIQTHWFAGACQAIKSAGMSGLYFWNLDAWAEPAKAATYNSGSFIGRGDSAIKTCFASGWPGQ
jgi:hypothetical protein